MIQVKFLYSQNLDELENKVNDWGKSHSLIDVKVSYIVETKVFLANLLYDTIPIPPVGIGGIATKHPPYITSTVLFNDRSGVNMTPFDILSKGDNLEGDKHNGD
jgi:hypothetical protein